MGKNQVFCDAVITKIRKNLRIKKHCTYFDDELSVSLVNVEAVQSNLGTLKGLGADTREFNSFLKDLLLCQLAELKYMLLQKNSKEKVGRIEQEIDSTRELLWPSKN